MSSEGVVDAYIKDLDFPRRQIKSRLPSFAVPGGTCIGGAGTLAR